MKKLSDMRRGAVSFSVNPLIPKPHTPMQWEGYDSKTLKKKIRFMRNLLKGLPVKFAGPRNGLIQYVLSCGGPDVGKLLEMAASSRVPFREWERHTPGWRPGDRLPWNNIDLGFREDFLMEEYIKMKRGILTDWCDESGCHGCMRKGCRG